MNWYKKTSFRKDVRMLTPQQCKIVLKMMFVWSPDLMTEFFSEIITAKKVDSLTPEEAHDAITEIMGVLRDDYSMSESDDDKEQFLYAYEGVYETMTKAIKCCT